MNDYEVQIFDRVYRKVSPLCADGKFVGTNIPTLTAFPAGSLVELSNTTVRSKQSSSQIENFSQVMYQLDIYALGKYACKEVYKAADEEMIGMGFTRISGMWLDNAGAPEVSRYTARYEAWIDRNGMIYRSP